VNVTLLLLFLFKITSDELAQLVGLEVGPYRVKDLPFDYMQVGDNFNSNRDTNNKDTLNIHDLESTNIHDIQTELVNHNGMSVSDTGNPLSQTEYVVPTSFPPRQEATCFHNVAPADFSNVEPTGFPDETLSQSLEDSYDRERSTDDCCWSTEDVVPNPQSIELCDLSAEHGYGPTIYEQVILDRPSFLVDDAPVTEIEGVEEFAGRDGSFVLCRNPEGLLTIQLMEGRFLPVGCLKLCNT